MGVLQAEIPKIDGDPNPLLRKIFFEDPGWQEVFDERAGILEYETGLDCTEAEALAHVEVKDHPLGD